MPTRADLIAELTAPGAPYALTEETVHGHRLRVHACAPRTLRDVLAVTHDRAERVATVYGDEHVTYGHNLRRVARLAAIFAAWGLEPGDRVGLCLRNHPEWVPVCFAAWVSGLVVVPLNAWWTAAELAYAVGDAGPRVIVADAERAPRLARPDGPRVVVVRGEEPPPGTVGWGSLDLDGSEGDDGGPVPALPDVALRPDDDAFVLYTSGTTGRPKGAVGTHRNLCTDVVNRSLAAAVAARLDGAPPPGRPGVLLTYPMFHVAGLCAMVTATWSGTTIATMHHWDADEARALVARERLTSATGVPTTMRELVATAAEHPEDLASLTAVRMGGASVPPAVVRRAAAVSLVPTNGYGLTETTSAIASSTGDDLVAAPDAVGRPVPSADVRVVDPASGADLADGEVGELWFSGPNVVRGYWNAPEATAAAFVDGWFRTGDLGWVRDGLIRVVDRLKDLVIRGGENVHCAEVEAVLTDHPEVLDAAVVGAPHASLGEEVAAVVVVGPGAGLDAAGVHDHVAARLAAFKAPTRVLVRTEPLPRNAVGKVLKADLRTAFG